MTHLSYLSGLAADAQVQLWLAVGLDEAASRFDPLPITLSSVKMSMIAMASMFAWPARQHRGAQRRPASPWHEIGRSGSASGTVGQSEAGAPWSRALRGILGIFRPRRQLLDAVAHIDSLSQERSRLLQQCLLMADTIRLSEGDRAALQLRIAIVRADERQRIAQDLHDQAGQEMAAAIAALRLLRDRSRGPNRRHLDEIARRLCEVGQRLHHAVVGDHPRIVEEQGLRGALETTVAAYAADAGLRRSLVVSGFREARLSRSAEATIYRVAQEAMTNVVKHARARRLKVRLIMTAASVSLIVSDDGIGFGCPLRPAESTESVGLGGMARRIAAIGGTLRIDTGPGIGTTVTATVPLDADRPEVPAS